MKVLLAEDDPIRAGELARWFVADPGIQLTRIGPAHDLAAAVAQHAPDVLLVDMARPDRDALDGIRQISRADPRPVVLFVDHDDPAFMEEAIAAGISSYHVLDTPPPDVKPMLRAAVALFRRHQGTADSLRAAQARLEERDIVDRAKALLIRRRRIAEPDAYHWLRRQAMARGQRIADVAAALLREAAEQGAAASQSQPEARRRAEDRRQEDPRHRTEDRRQLDPRHRAEDRSQPDASPQTGETS